MCRVIRTQTPQSVRRLKRISVQHLLLGTMRRYNYFALPVLIVFAGCGGGGGGSKSTPTGSGANVQAPSGVGYTLSESKITREFSVLDTGPVIAEIGVTFASASPPPFGFGGQFSTNGLGGVLYESTSPQKGTITLSFLPPYQKVPGTYVDTISFGACSDASCATTSPNSTSIISATYTVTPATLPTVEMSTRVVNVTALEGEVFPAAPVDITATVSQPAPFSGYTTTTTKNGVDSALFTGVSSTTGKLTINFKRPSTLQKGTYTDTITPRMCLDQGCVNPLVVTPSTITVNYTITDTVDGPSGFTAKLTSAYARDVVWDPTHARLYLAVPDNAPEHGATITPFDPTTRTFGESISIGSDPGLLAISDDNQLLYVSEAKGNLIRRFTTSPLTQGMTISLGNDPDYSSDVLVASDLAVAPGQPQMLAVLRSNPKISGTRGMVLFDDDSARPNIAFSGSSELAGLIKWGDDSTHLYTNHSEVAVDSNGLMKASSYPGVSGRFERVGNRIFGEDGGVTDVVTRTALPKVSLLGYFGAVVGDAAAGRIYFVTTSRQGLGTLIEIYDANTLSLIGTGRLPYYEILNTPRRAVRWGKDGLAIVTSSNNLILVTGPLIVP